jgi:7-cyano-7-deazaguanine synthase
MKKAIVLLSGGLDSAVTLYLAKKQGFKPFCLIFDYGQRHKREIESARKIARVAHCPAQVIKIDLLRQGSALLDRNIDIPERENETTKQRNNAIPSTYVPARNIIFLSFALSYTETIKAEAVFIGAHSQDYSGYPDCRPEFYHAFKEVVSTGIKSGKRKIKIHTPLIHKTKAQIIRIGNRLGVPFGLTWSCYQGGKRPCDKCDSCYFRAKGFKEAGLKDPLRVGTVPEGDCPATR